MPKLVQRIFMLSFVFLLPSAFSGTITENFDGGVFDSNLFEVSEGTGSAASGRWISPDRATFRTVATDLKPTASNVLVVEADLTFAPTSDIAFLGFRSAGTRTNSNEPGNGLLLRMHNFSGGLTHVSTDGPNALIGTFNPPQGDSFYALSTVRIKVTDNGSLVNVEMQNLNTLATHQFQINTGFNNAINHVIFSGNSSVAWDNISITHSTFADPVPEPNTILLLFLGVLFLSKKRA